MQLTEEQKNEVRQWVVQGAGLSEVQKRIRDQFGVSLTYIDVRLLVIDLGAKVADKPEKRAGPVTPPPEAAMEEPSDVEEGTLEPEHAPGGGQVTIQVDRIMKPGSLVSGTVAFTDGVSAVWMIDQMGRLGLAPERRGYKPSQSDLAAFQLELRKVLETRGY
jgi:hypothetical protein